MKPTDPDDHFPFDFFARRLVNAVEDDDIDGQIQAILDLARYHSDPEQFLDRLDEAVRQELLPYEELRNWQSYTGPDDDDPIDPSFFIDPNQPLNFHSER